MRLLLLSAKASVTMDGMAKEASVPTAALVINERRLFFNI
jgi:hypothetical protein